MATLCFTEQAADPQKDKFKLEWVELPRPELQVHGVEYSHLFEKDPGYQNAIKVLAQGKDFNNELK